mgnify:CR=1 FL=1
MKKLFSLLLVVAAMVLTLAACGTANAGNDAADEPKNDVTTDTVSPAPAEETPESTGNKVLVAYFSATGHTKTIAEYLQATLDADLYEIVPQEPYTDADLDWMDKKSRSTIEMNAPKSRPAIAGQVADMVQYDTVFVGSPIWWGQAPKIVYTFLESYDFSGKTVIPFATSGGSGMGGEDILKAACSKDTKWLPGKRLSSCESAASVQKWVESLGL